MASSSPTPRRRRVWWKIGAGLLACVVAGLVAFPWFLGTEPARRWLLGRANRAMSPGGFEFTTIRFSWFGPTRLTGFVLRDAQGDRVVDAPTATWDRSLHQALFERPRYGTLTLDRAVLDVQRRADGTVDLYETIKPLLGLNPKTSLQILIRQGRLRYRDASQPAPVSAEQADVAVEIHPSPGPITWDVRLEKPGIPASTLGLRGEYNRWKGGKGRPSDLTVQLRGSRWPWTLSGRGLETSGRFGGRISAKRRNGEWALDGRADVDDLDANGPTLAGDHLKLDRVAATWDFIGKTGSWEVRNLEVTSPIGSLKATGTLPGTPDNLATIEGNLDLAAVARQIPRALHLREGISVDRGEATLRIESRATEDGQAWNVQARITDLEAHNQERPLTLREPATLSARILRRTGELSVEELALRTSFLDLKAKGDVDRGLGWSGTFELGGLQRELKGLVDFGKVELAGKGDVSGTYRRTAGTYQGRLELDVAGLQVAGLVDTPLRRDSAHATATVEGAASESGLPETWSTLALALTSGASAAELSASAKPDTTAVTLNLKSPVVLGDLSREATGRLEAHSDGAGLAIERLTFGLAPSEGAKAGEAIQLAGRGHFDRKAGELVLAPIPDDASGSSAIALEGEGLRVSGIGQGKIEASLTLAGDVAALARSLRTAEAARDNTLAGRWSARATAESLDDGTRLAGKIDLPQLSWGAAEASSRRQEGPISLTWTARRPTASDRLDVSEVVFASPYATLEGSGRIEELNGRRLADLRGRLTPDWKVINTMLAERVEPRARLSGQAREWRLRGTLSGDSSVGPVEPIEGDFGFELDDLDIYGLHMGKTPIVVRSREGRLSIDPIDTTLNGGRLRLAPEVKFEEGGRTSIHLGSSSTITNAEINDEVSRRFLSYVAPVLDRATRAHGRVSVNLTEAVFPIGGESKKDASVEGQVLFQDVEFAPGPLADQILALLGREDRPTLKLDAPVSLSIADRRVYQDGFALPLGKLTHVELEGWVDFDRNLDLTASIPLTPAMVGNRPLLGNVLDGTRVRVPIRGTLQKPEIDREALNLALKDLGKTLLERGAVEGATKLLQRLIQGRDPNAPPPPTREERRARRQERREQRRAERQNSP